MKVFFLWLSLTICCSSEAPRHFGLAGRALWFYNLWLHLSCKRRWVLNHEYIQISICLFVLYLFFFCSCICSLFKIQGLTGTIVLYPSFFLVRNQNPKAKGFFSSKTIKGFIHLRIQDILDSEYSELEVDDYFSVQWM